MFIKFNTVDWLLAGTQTQLVGLMTHRLADTHTDGWLEQKLAGTHTSDWLAGTKF